MQKKVLRIDLALVDEIKAFRAEIKNAESRFGKTISDGEALLKQGLNPPLGKNLSSNIVKLESLVKEMKAWLNEADGKRNEALSLSNASNAIYKKYTEGLSMGEKLGLDMKELRGYSSLFNEAKDFKKKYYDRLDKLGSDFAALL